MTYIPDWARYPGPRFNGGKFNGTLMSGRRMSALDIVEGAGGRGAWGVPNYPLPDDAARRHGERDRRAMQHTNNLNYIFRRLDMLMLAHSIEDILIHCTGTDCRGLMRVVRKANIDPEKRTPVYRCDSCSAERALTDAESSALPENGGFKRPV